MTDKVKSTAIICATALAIVIIAGIISIQMTHGDVSAYIHDLGIIAGVLVINGPILWNTFKTKEKLQETKDQVTQVQQKVNGELPGTINQAVKQAMHEVNGGQDDGTPGSTIPSP